MTQNFANRIKLLLKKKGLSQNAFSKMLGIKQATLNRNIRLENNEELAPLLWKICEICSDVSRDWLFFGEGEPFGNASAEWNPEYVRVGDTLFDLVPMIGHEKFMAAAGINESRLNDLMGGKALPTAEELTAWLLKLHVSANFILCQIGNDVLTDEEFEDTIPQLQKIRENFGDFEHKKKIKELEKEIHRITELANAHASSAQAWKELAEDRKKESLQEREKLDLHAPKEDNFPVVHVQHANITNKKEKDGDSHGFF